jgi:hypothetical protein
MEIRGKISNAKSTTSLLVAVCSSVQKLLERLANTPASYSGCPEFKSRLVNLLLYYFEYLK